ncbi:MAG: hypothetical protein D6766_12060 [Verrucomicrobia bacterium]|nr:MAG: hypothetical protein D6766_12060 [Verrucomicrobiota bacterium]
MNLPRFSPFLLGLALALPAAAADNPSPETPPAPPIEELLGVVRSNLTDLAPAELNRVAVEALVRALAPRVAWADTPAAEAAPTNLWAAVRVVDERFLYLRPARIAAGLDEALTGLLESRVRGQSLQGAILDLRFVGGEAYPEVVRLLGRAVDRDTPVLDWGKGLQRAAPGEQRLPRPLLVLINRETRAAAEALAEVLRREAGALLLGGATAGHAYVFREVPLSTGQRLRLAAGRVRLADGHELPATGVAPDIPIEVSLEAQRRHLDDPKVFEATVEQSKPSPDRVNAGARRLTEADLVRLHSRNGLTTTNPAPEAPATPAATTTIRETDPILARALDLLRVLPLLQRR